MRRVLDYLEAEAAFEEPLENGDAPSAQASQLASGQTPGVEAAVRYLRELFALCQVRAAHAAHECDMRDDRLAFMCLY